MSVQSKIEYLDHPEPGWFVLDVMQEGRKRVHWVAFLIDVHPDDLKNHTSRTAVLYVPPDDYRPGPRVVQERWFRIPGKHKSRDAAWDALEDTMALRH
jgi:hypothetical protein